jgi:hypothetical protein
VKISTGTTSTGLMKSQPNRVRSGDDKRTG